MINDLFVIDAVLHAFNFSDDNVMPGRLGSSLRDQLAGGYWHGTRPAGERGDRADRREYHYDQPIDHLARAQFLETSTDMGVFHTLPLFSFFRDGAIRHEKTVEAVTNYPSRFLGYCGVDPSAGVQEALDTFDRQLQAVPEQARERIVGLKLYPAQADTTNPRGYRSWRMDDPEVAFPLFQRALDYGIRTVAIHKAMPLGLIPPDPYQVDDIAAAAAMFPDLTIEIVHAGFAFSQQTAMLMAQFPNVYAHLEVTSALALASPGQFETIMAEMMFWAGPEKIIYGSAGNIMGAGERILQAFTAFQFSDETCEKWGIDKISDDDRRLMLADNYARIIGLDLERAKAVVANDEFEKIKREKGVQPHRSTWSVP